MPLTEIGPFTISYLQVLDEQGNVDAALDPALPAEQLLAMHRTMRLAREADQRMLKLQRQGRIGTFPPTTGQEAASVGPAFAMTDKDWFVPAFRELPGMLARGYPLENHLLYYNGFEEGNRMPQGLRMLPTCVPVGSQTLHAVGMAYAMQSLGETDAAVVVFFGDGASSQGDVHEAMNFATVWQVPVVFICQNNQWAISMPRKAQAHSRTLAQRAIAYDMPGVQVDGNDVLAMYRATSEALARARTGGGPSLIEAVTYRLEVHTTADDPGRYRTQEEVKLWWTREPLVRMEHFLRHKGLLDDDAVTTLEAEVKARIDAAVRTFESRPPVAPDLPFEHVFGTRHAGLEKQRAEFLDSLKQEAGNG